MDKPDYIFSPPPDAANRTDEFRQLYRDGVLRTLDARPVQVTSIKEEHWSELMLLLQNKNPINQLYAIEQLDKLSLAGRADDSWLRSEDFKRKAVLTALLPLISSRDEKVACAALNCFATESGAEVALAPFRNALAERVNHGRSGLSRLIAIKALSGTDGDAVSNTLASLSRNPEEAIRISAVTLLPRFAPEFAEQILRERAKDNSPYVRSVVADVIGAGKYERLLPMLAQMFAGSTGPVPLIKPLPDQALGINPHGNGTGDVRSRAGSALVQFDVDEVADILRSNLQAADFHIAFVSKLAEKDALPWLVELTNILDSRIKEVDEFLKLSPSDPKRYLNPTGERVLIDYYGKCWEDIRQYLLRLPPEQLNSREMDRYMDLLDKAARPVPWGGTEWAKGLYELYRTKGLSKRAGEIRRQYDTERWWFDDFDQHHSVEQDK